MIRPIAIMATGLGLLAWGVYRAVHGPQSPLPAPSDDSPIACPLDVPQARKSAHVAAAPVIARAVAEVLGREGRPAERHYAQAVAFLETSYGKGWSAKSGMGNCNNWGAVQCRDKAESPTCHMWEDSYSSGEKYTVGFKCYETPDAGALDVVKHVLKHRPLTAKALASDKPTAYRASYAMRREKYYGGFCPKATSRYGGEPAKQSLASPDRDEGTRACAREAIELHAKRAHSLVVEIACATGETPMPLGNYEDAEQWYSSLRNA